DAFNRTIAMFMEDTMRSLLKYDVTIDKFLGDGVLAFSNAPIARHDYVMRLVESAVAIRERVLNRSSQYRDHWGDEFQIRIGIAEGEARVGFYGSQEYFKSYTAIGEVVNLASRLCGFAGPNKIVASREVIDLLPKGSYELRE